MENVVATIEREIVLNQSIKACPVAGEKPIEHSQISINHSCSIPENWATVNSGHYPKTRDSVDEGV